MKTVNSLKLVQHDSIDLDRLSYSNGDIVYDVTNGLIRIMNGVSLGGTKVANQSWVTSNFASTTSLSNYVTNTSLTTTLSGYVTTTQQTTALSSYATTASLSSYATTASLTSYATTASLSSYATTASLSSYVTNSSLSTTLGTYVTSSGLSTALSSYATNTNLALKASLSSPTLSGTLTVPTAIIGGVNIKAFALAVAAALA